MLTEQPSSTRRIELIRAVLRVVEGGCTIGLVREGSFTSDFSFIGPTDARLVLSLLDDWSSGRLPADQASFVRECFPD